MQYNNQTAETIHLIAVAQTTTDAEKRNHAMHELWEIHGERLVGIMAKKSYQIDSDFGYRGCSFKERQNNLMGEAYLVLHDAVMTFDLGKGVPFAAYIAQKGNWHVADEKRENSKHGKWEKSVDFTVESISAGDTLDEKGNVQTLRKVLAFSAGFDEKICQRDAVLGIYHATEQYPRLHRYFGVCLELLDEDADYSDAEIARRMGCTRANVGACKKALIRMMKADWRFEDVCPRTAA